MATKAEVAAARAARRNKTAIAPVAPETVVSADNVAQGSHVVITPAGNANILPKPSPELVSVHALPGNLAQKTDYLGNLYDLPSDGVVRAHIARLADTADRPHLEAAVKLLENQYSGPVVHHQVPNATTGVMEYFDAAGNKIDKPKIIAPPTFVPAKVAEPESAVSALPDTATKAEKAAAAKADKDAKAKAKKDAAVKAKSDKAAAAAAKKAAK